MKTIYYLVIYSSLCSIINCESLSHSDSDMDEFTLMPSITGYILKYYKDAVIDTSDLDKDKYYSNFGCVYDSVVHKSDTFYFWCEPMRFCDTAAAHLQVCSYTTRTDSIFFNLLGYCYDPDSQKYEFPSLTPDTNLIQAEGTVMDFIISFCAFSNNYNFEIIKQDEYFTVLDSIIGTNIFDTLNDTLFIAQVYLHYTHSSNFN